MTALLEPGTIVDGFRIESFVGEGAVGRVYLARETATGRHVALKLLGPELARDERFRRRFLRETELAASFDHLHVVKTIASGEEDGALYLAMVYVAGSDLRKLLRTEGPLDPERALGLVGQVADALDAAHATGLVHRDVKPGNILVTETETGEEALVCDFGLARHVSSVSSLTVDRGFVGTIDYVSPEQIESGEVDSRADVYSLGCVLFECLAGVSPFERESELSVLFAHLNDPPPRLTDERPDLPAELDAMFAIALAKSPDDRYQTCRELVRAARAALQGKVLARRRRLRSRVLVALTAVVLVAGAAVAAILATRGTPSRHVAGLPISLRPSALNLIDARTQQVVDHIDVGTQVPIADTGWDAVFTKHAAWVWVAARQHLIRVDLRTRRVTASPSVPWPVGAVTSSGNSLWVAQDTGPELEELAGDSGKVVRHLRIQGGKAEGAVAYGAGSLWLASRNGVIRVDPTSGRIVHRFPISGISSLRIVYADGAVWAARQGDGVIAKIDPVANLVVHHTPLHGWVSDLVVGGGSVWVSIVPGGVYRLSEDALAVQQTFAAGADPEQMSFGGGALWIADPTASTVSRIAQVSGARETLSGRGADAVTAAYHDGLVWVAASPALPPLPPIAGQQLDIVAGGVASDPAHNGLFDEQVLYTTCAKLLNYPDASGAEGARLRPEVAAAMPSISPDGRTYTFRIRQGFRFSPPSNAPVTAQTFRHTIEREIATSPKDVGIDPYVADIVGARAFYAGKAPHVAGLSVHGSRLSITLVKATGDLPARMAMPRFCAVPLSTPLRGGGEQLIPSAGPYYIASSAGPRSVLLPNPNYHGTRPRRSARIVVETNVPETKAVSLADQGAVDMIAASSAGELLNAGGVIDRRSETSSAVAQQYHLYQGPIFDYFVFNTRRPLFRSPGLRQAVDYALDRRALASAFGDLPADRVVPPAVPGYPAGRIFGSIPDLVAARKLAGAGRRHAVLYICGDTRERKMAEIVRRNLAAIGIGVSVLEDAQCPGNPYTAAKSRRADLFLVSGFPLVEVDERDPARFLVQVLQQGAYGTPLPDAGWNRRSFHRRLDQAQPLRGAQRVAAYHRLADELTRTGPIAVFGSWVWPEYFSPRVGCKIFQTEYGVADLGALCKGS
jgi:ABC-type oligopeptide transport system substrate-binding subunit